ncbi:MAG: UDP-N-acetylmuramoyl-L-alanine--D-glutamate ligase [Spirochaetaceae bacterium]|jgi:UDP-N-acetylmuramoylalanine--D-glutamate ligase|nr:UDP-N-acetylmuramoyl-L-alanine--D-glutamate ligase [Spirochaetaceae bacterium]
METSYSGVKALVMGLGLHGGGLGAACFLARRGAELTVTDLRDESVLRPSIEALDGFIAGINAKPVRYVLGRHDKKDFSRAGIVIKNPGVPPDSPYLRATRLVETDISLFLKHNPAKLTAVTGSKGKSFTASAIHFLFQEACMSGKIQGRAFLGGNITVSPLTFLDELTPADEVVLELSSWQLGDLPPGLLKPRSAVLTAIMSDHLDRYGAMEAYVKDKRVIYEAQDRDDATIAGDDSWGKSFLRESKGRVYCYRREAPSSAEGFDIPGAFFDKTSGACFVRGPVGCIPFGEKAEIAPALVRVPGLHQKINLMAAALAALERGLAPEFISECTGRFPGIEHRMEFFCENNGARFYNDTAATIPEAACAAIKALGSPVVVTGGTDKNLDFSPLADALLDAAAVILLDGTGSDKLIPMLEERHIPWSGPFDNIDEAASAACRAALPGGAVILSPGCASFGMFNDEFDRGRKWKAAVRELTQIKANNETWSADYADFR